MREVALVAAAHAAGPEAQELATIAAQLPTITATVKADPSVSADNQPSGAH